ncbi:hypothetical protein SETIT_4G014600v2 [Setaria italica]|uniref:Uncharacterized protein n=1 Tax=Setaria italica TaxID=4555 RepID=A0A368QQ21_SETIT|nr:hypothetical protein SETIT_4G014600v2 [Setaria italica]
MRSRLLVLVMLPRNPITMTMMVATIAIVEAKLCDGLVSCAKTSCYFLVFEFSLL